MKLAAAVFSPLLLMALDVGPASASTFDYCACLQSSSHVAKGRRDDGGGVSIIVPRNANRTSYWQEYSRLGFGVAWTVGATRIRIGSSSKLDRSIAESASNPWKQRCHLEINDRNAEISTLDEKGSITLNASFDDPLGKPNGTYYLSIEARSPRIACVVGAKLFWSAVPGVDSWADLRLLAIAADRKSFVFTNSIGVKISAKVGDYISREYSRVVRIDAKSATVEGIEPDGAGGWKEFRRQMTFEPTLQTK